MAKPNPAQGSWAITMNMAGSYWARCKIFIPVLNWKKKITSTHHHLTVQSAWGEVLPSGGTDLEDTVL